MGIRSLELSRWARPVLGDEGVQTIHAATLSVLGRTGIRVHSAAILAALRRAGMPVDDEGGRVRIPSEFIDAALAAAPRAYTLAARDPELDLRLDGARGFLSVDGSAAEVLDPETGRRRPSTAADLVSVTRLADSLPEIAFLWQGAEAGDVPVALRPLHELRIQLTHSSKHVQLMTAVTPEAAEGAVALAAAVSGGADALRTRPLLSTFQVSLSPLAFEGAALEAALVYARAGVPAGFVVMPITCATAPATPAGTIVQSNAELLAGVTILETLVPGAPTFYGACPTVMDLRSALIAGGGPEDALFQLALAELGRHYGLPTSIGTFATGAKRPDWQSGLENTLSGLASLLGGADMLSGAGLLHAARVFSVEQLVLDAEIFGLLCRFAAGIDLAADELAIDVIDAVGPGGNFLAEEHTVRTMRRLWQPRFFDRGTWEAWEDAGRGDPVDRARAYVRDRLASHEPAALPAGVADELDRIVAEFERRAAAAS
jgi:trimethylamine--corrinoid protein Co-methyltransferase